MLKTVFLIALATLFAIAVVAGVTETCRYWYNEYRQQRDTRDLIRRLRARPPDSQA